MHVDHIIYAANPDGLQASADRLSKLLGAPSRDGGFHPRFGTRNRLIPVAHGRYVEIVEVLDHPAAEKAPFGQVVRARSEAGGGWLGWALSVDDMAPIEARLDRESVPGNRTFPDGRQLEWRQIGIKGLQADPQLPFFLKWVSDDVVRPSALTSELEMIRIEIAGDKSRLDDWINGDSAELLDIDIEWVAPHGQPGLIAAHFDTPLGKIRI